MTLLMVGDVDQMMYRFAGAKPEIMTEYVDRYYPDIETYFLDTNYRSTRQIIETCSRLIAHNYSDMGGPYDQKFMKFTQPRPDAPEGDPVTFELHPDPDSEAISVANSILEEMAAGYNPGDFFVGARTRNQLAYIEGAFSRAKIPYINIAGGSFWTLSHVADVIAYVRLAANSHDDEAFLRIYNIASDENRYHFGEREGEYCPHRFLGKAFLEASKRTFLGVQSALNSGQGWRWQKGVEDLENMLYRIQSALHRGGVGFAVEQTVKSYTRYLKTEEGITSEDEAENGKLEDLNTVIAIASTFDDVNSFIAYVSDMVEMAQAAKDKSWDEYVVISTIHKLKGLERPVVYGIGFSEGITKNNNIESPSGLLPHTFSMIEPPQNGILPTGGMGSIEDECCVAFVLVSRAKVKCSLSGTQIYGKMTLDKSRFIDWMEIE